MTFHTYPTTDTVRTTAHGSECRYCGQTVTTDATTYRHTHTGDRRCHPSARTAHENRLSDNLIRR